MLQLLSSAELQDSQVDPTIMIIAHKDMPSALVTNKVALLREDCFALSFLFDSGEPHWEDRAKDGDYVSGTYITEFSTVSYAQRASVVRSGFGTTL